MKLLSNSFVGGLVDALNAEIALGTVTNVSEGVSWIGYTYLLVRMQRNPMFYGEGFFYISLFRNLLNYGHRRDV